MLPWWDVADFFTSSVAGRTEAWENTCQLASWIRPLKAVMADRQEVDSLLQLWGCPPTEYKDIFLTLWALLSNRCLKARPPPTNQSPFLSLGASVIFYLSYKHHRVTCKSFYISYNLIPIILPECLSYLADWDWRLSSFSQVSVWTTDKGPGSPGTVIIKATDSEYSSHTYNTNSVCDTIHVEFYTPSQQGSGHTVEHLWDTDSFCRPTCSRWGNKIAKIE